MNFIKVKKPSTLHLDGINIDLEMVTNPGYDPKIMAAKFTDAAGNIVVVTTESRYAMEVLVPAPPKKEDRWVLSGNYVGQMPFEEEFEHEDDAMEKAKKMAAACGHETGKLTLDSLTLEAIGLKIEKREVEVS